MVPSEFFQLVLGCPLARPGAQEHCFEVSGGAKSTQRPNRKNKNGCIGNAGIPRTQVGVFLGCLGVVSGCLLFRSAQDQKVSYIYISNRDHDNDTNIKSNDNAAFHTIIVLVLARMLLSFLLSLLL